MTEQVAREESGLVCAIVFDGRGGGRMLDWAGINAWRESDGVLWVHLDRAATDARHWIEGESRVPALMADALLAEEVRPRLLVENEAMLINLRGVNLNPGADPDDMVAVRIWITKNEIISVRHRRLMAVNEIRARLESGRGPRNPSEWLAELADRLIERMGPVIGDLDEEVDALELDVIEGKREGIRRRLGDVRQTTIALRRYLAPQRDVMTRLPPEVPAWFERRERNRLRETADKITRYVEDLESCRDRAVAAQDEFNTRIADQMNRTVYVLTVVAAVLLPAGLITGLFGINVGGMPGTDHQWAFYEVIGLIVGVSIVEVIVLRWLKWI
jgi:zinc transporter